MQVGPLGGQDLLIRPTVIVCTIVAVVLLIKLCPGQCQTHACTFNEVPLDSSWQSNAMGQCKTPIAVIKVFEQIG